MKEKTFHAVSNRLTGILNIYKEAYPSATVSRTYEHSIFQDIRAEINIITSMLVEEIEGRPPRMPEEDYQDHPRPPDAPPSPRRVVRVNPEVARTLRDAAGQTISDDAARYLRQHAQQAGIEPNPFFIQTPRRETPNGSDDE